MTVANVTEFGAIGTLITCGWCGLQVNQIGGYEIIRERLDGEESNYHVWCYSMKVREDKSASL